MKRAAENLDNQGRYERTALFLVWHEDFRTLSASDLWSNRLLGKVESCHDLATKHGATHGSIALQLSWRQVTFSRGDVVLVGGKTPFIMQHACLLDGRFAIVVNKCDRRETVSETASR